VSNEAPVFTFVALTAAPDTLAPLGSVTRPVIDARSFCARTDEQTATKHNTTQNSERRVDLIMTAPLSPSILSFYVTAGAAPQVSSKCAAPRTPTGTIAPSFHQAE
jgi:hypothetical protein